MKNLDVVTFGEAMVLFRANEPGELKQVEHFSRTLAGAETNVAIGLARLGYHVGWVSQVGNDSFGQYVLRVLGQAGVDTSSVNTDSIHSTGFQLKSQVKEGDPDVEYFRKHSAASVLEWQHSLTGYFTNARHLHMTGIPPALSSSMRRFAEEAQYAMKSAKKTVSFDPNLRPILWRNHAEMVNVVNQFAANSDYVLPGLREGEILTGYQNPRDIAAFYLEKGVKLVVVKLGPEGAYYRTHASEGKIRGFYVSKVIDTVGAGDGFAVGVLSGLLDGLTVEEAVCRGNAIGAMAVMSPGDMDGLPTWQGLTDFMKQYERSC